MEYRSQSLTAREEVRNLIRERLQGGSYSRDSLPAASRNIRSRLAVFARFDDLERAGLVKMEFPEDSYWSFEDLEGECYNVDLNASSVPGGARTILAQRKAFRERVDRDGVCSIVGYFRNALGSWEVAYSVGGCVRADVEEGHLDDYIYDVMQATIDALIRDTESIDATVSGIIQQNKDLRSRLGLD